MKRDYSNLPEHLPVGKLAFNDSTNELFIGAGDDSPPQKVTDMDIHDELNQASIDYSGEHHENLKDSMDANVDFIMGEFNSTQMTGEFITAQNTLPRHLKRAELRGHTEVNLIQEPSGQDLVLPYEFEDTQSLTLEDTKESGAVNIVLKGNTEVNVLKNPVRDYVVPYEFEEGYTATLTDTKETGSVKSAILKGQTLVNLVDYTEFPYSSNIFNNDFYLKYELKTNTTYTIIVDINLNGVEPDTFGMGLLQYGVDWASNNSKYVNGLNKVKLTTNNLIANCLRIRGKGIIINYAIVIEGDYTNVDIPYFEGMQSVKLPVLTTTGKNLFNLDDNLHCLNRLDNGRYHSTPHKAFSVPKLKPNTAYTLSFSVSEFIDKTLQFPRINYTDGSVQVSYRADGTFNGNPAFIMKSNPNKTISHFDFSYGTNNERLEFIDFQIEEGDISTSYEPYKTNILSTSDDVILRGIGDVKDTLDCLTGEVTQRIGEIVLDGSENWVKPSSQPTNTSRFLLLDFPNNKNAKTLSNIRVKKNAGEDEIGIWCDTNTVLNVDTSVDTVESLKVFLSKNPINLQYSLATESIKTVDLTVQDQDGLSVPALSTYNEVTYLSASSQEGSLRPLITSKIPEFPVMIKPDTKYSIVADTTENGHEAVPLTYNLGGAEIETEIGNKVTVIQTPSTLTNETFKVTGTGMKLSNIMILEKDLTGKEIPNYTEGMNSVKVSEIKTTGKNLFNAYACTLDKSSHPNLIMEAKSQNSIRVALLENETGWRAGFIDYQLEPHSWYKIRCTVTGDLGLKELGFYVPEVTGWNPDSRGCTESNNFLGHIRTLDSGIVTMRFNGSGAESTTFDLTYSNIQIEKVENKDVAHSSYEAYKESKVTFPEIQLNSVGTGTNRLEDKFNPQTGVLERATFYGVLDGSENWKKYGDGKFQYDATLGQGSSTGNTNQIICSNHIEPVIYGTWIQGETYEPLNNHSILFRTTSISIYKNDINNDIELLKEWLRENPIEYITNRVKDEETKVETEQIDIKGSLKTYNTVTNFTSTVPEGALNPIISHKDLEYEVLLKPNTKYSIITNPISNGHTNSPISFDLGGTSVETVVGNYCTLVTTPSTLTHEKLVMRGRGNKLSGGVMIFEGDKTGMSFSHFDGMKSVENPVFKTVGKNLFDSEHFCSYLGLTPLKGGFLCNTHTKKYPFKTFGRTCMTVKHKGLEGATSGKSIIQVNYADGTVGHTSLSNLKYVWEKPIDSIQVNSWQGGPTEVTEIMWYYVENNETTYLSYEPYESNTLSLTIPLRSLPNGVCDTLDLITGEYVQNTHSVLFDENCKWLLWNNNPADVVSGYIYYDRFPIKIPTPKNFGSSINDRLPSNAGGHIARDEGARYTSYFTMSIHKDKIRATDVNDVVANSPKVQQWFTENPMTFVYELEEPITTKLDLVWEDGKLFAYDGTTHFFVDVDGGHLQPVLDIDVPVNIVAELSRLRAEKEQLESYNGQLENQLSLLSLRNSDLQSNVQSLVAENSQLKLSTQDLQTRSNVLQLKNKELKQHQEKLQAENVELQERASQLTQATENLTEGLHTVDAVRESGDLELLSSDFDLDFRLMEIEFALDIPMSLFKGVKTMARTPYEMAKTLILGGKYDRADMEYKLGRYLERKQITQDQYDELIALMDATELVG